MLEKSFYFLVTKVHQVPEVSVPKNGKYNFYNKGLANCVFSF